MPNKKDSEVTQMSPNITLKKDYILIEIEEPADFREIRRGIGRLCYVPELPDRNDVWVFRKGLVSLSHDDLYKLRDIIKEVHPKDSKVHKTALVVTPEVQSRMAEEFSQLAQNLQHEFKVFTRLQDAETWIKGVERRSGPKDRRTQFTYLAYDRRSGIAERRQHQKY
jgi:hypothetical protein